MAQVFGFSVLTLLTLFSLKGLSLLLYVAMLGVGEEAEGKQSYPTCSVKTPTKGIEGPADEKKGLEREGVVLEICFRSLCKQTFLINLNSVKNFKVLKATLTWESDFFKQLEDSSSIPLVQEYCK